VCCEQTKFFSTVPPLPLDQQDNRPHKKTRIGAGVFLAVSTLKEEIFTIFDSQSLSPSSDCITASYSATGGSLLMELSQSFVLEDLVSS
jgi:hypothetical protein